MAVSKDTIKATYPLPVYNYRVTILSSGETQTVISCSEVRGLQMEVEPISYQDGMSFLMGDQILPGRSRGVQISIRKGITQMGTYLSDWMGTVYPRARSANRNPPKKRDVLIDLCDEGGEPLIRWTVSKALPIRLLAPTFDANSNETAIEQLELVGQELLVEYLNA